MELMDAIRTRRSVRKYAPESVTDEQLATVLEAAQLAPTACNNQPFKLIVVRDAELREKLVPACKGQKFVGQAPIVLVGCGSEPDSYPKQAGWMNTFAIDTTIVFDHITLAAVDVGLGTCWIGAFLEDQVREILGIPASWRVVCLTPLGVPAESPDARDRKGLEELVCEDGWE
ncbi:MAG TPA: nitroreductase family protein [Armatimonadota bacterium]|nr:nitroreductase family protein [Armatimonadota bacterium]